MDIMANSHFFKTIFVQIKQIMDVVPFRQVDSGCFPLF